MGTPGAGQVPWGRRGSSHVKQQGLGVPDKRSWKRGLATTACPQIQPTTGFICKVSLAQSHTHHLLTAHGCS